MSPASSPLAAALVTALATGLGAGPFLFVDNLARSWVGVANALAAGFMIAASALLFYEGARESIVRTAAVPWWASFRRLGVAPAGWTEARPLRAARRRRRRRVLLLVGVMTVHSFAEGIGVGVSFGGGAQLGLVTRSQLPFTTSPKDWRSASSRSQGVGVCALPAGASLEFAPAACCRSSFLFVAFFDGLVPSDSASPAARCSGWSVARSYPTRCTQAQGDRSLSLGCVDCSDAGTRSAALGLTEAGSADYPQRERGPSRMGA